MKYVGVFLLSLALTIGLGACYLKVLTFPDEIKLSLSNPESNPLEKHLAYDEVRVEWQFPIHLAVRLDNFRIGRDRSAQPLFRADSAVIRIGWKDFLRREVQLSKTSFVNPSFVFVTEPGHENWKNWNSFTSRALGSRPEKLNWNYIFTGFNVNQASVSIRNDSLGRSWSIHQVDLILTIYDPSSSWRVLVRKDFEGKKLDGQIDLDVLNHNVAFQALFNKGEFEIEGDIAQYNKSFSFSGELLTKEMNLQPFCQRLLLRCDQVGTMTGNFEFEGTGYDLDWKTVRWRGLVDFRAGMVGQYRFIEEALMNAMSQKTFSELNHQSGQWLEVTLKQISGKPFDLLQTEIRNDRGVVTLDGLRMKHPDYYLEGGGQIDLASHFVDFKAKIVLLEELSDRLTAKIPQIQAYKNSKGRMPLPFLYHGAAKALEWNSPSAGS